jgi:hypothetical protein
MVDPGDQSQLKTAAALATKQHYQKVLWYHVFEFCVGLVFYTPNFQKWKNNDDAASLSTKQYSCLVIGSFMLLHAITNIVILLYKNCSETHSGTLYFDVLTSVQKKLLGLVSSPPKSEKVEYSQKSPSKHNCSLFSPDLPTIKEPLIDDKLLTRVPVTPKKIANKNSPNRSLLSQSTMDLIKWKHNASNTNLLKNTSDFIMNDSKVEDLLNSSSWANQEVYSEDDELVDASHLTPNISRMNHHQSPSDNHDLSQNLSFYTNKSFLNSFDEHSSPNKNPAKNLDAWTNNTSFHIIDKTAVKKAISEQVYRTSTPPTSPSKLDLLMGDGHLKKDIPNSPLDTDKKIGAGDVKIGKSNFLVTNKYTAAEQLKAWLNISIFSPLKSEINNVNKTFKSKGLNPIEKMTTDQLKAVLSNDIIDSTLGSLEKAEIATKRTHLELHRAQLLRMLPYLEINNKNSVPLEPITARINALAEHAYLSNFKQGANSDLDSDLVTNALVEFFNSASSVNRESRSNSFIIRSTKNWFSNRYITGSELFEKDVWEKNFNKLENPAVKSLLQTMYNQKRINDASENPDKDLNITGLNLSNVSLNSTILNNSILNKTEHQISPENQGKIIDEISPFLVRVKGDSMLLVKSGREVFEFGGRNGSFECWLAFFQLIQDNSEKHKKLGSLIPV